MSRNLCTIRRQKGVSRGAAAPARRSAVKAARLAVLTSALALAFLSNAALAGSGRVSIKYGLSLAGLPIGTGSLNAVISNDSYRVDAAARIGGILALLSDGRGSGTASGRMSGAKPQSSGFSLTSISDDKAQTVRMTMAGGRITKAEISPPLTVRRDRVPVGEGDKKGVVDPLSALLMPVTGSGPTLTPAACDRTLPVFDGAQRFNVTLAFSRMETVKGESGYSGPVIVCSARYVPIAGHRPKREQTRFMAANRDLEIWLAPISGTRILAPWRIVVGTQIGRLTIDATVFSTSGEDIDKT
jgi:Protein of unknown function (DUF3108)